MPADDDDEDRPKKKKAKKVAKKPAVKKALRKRLSGPRRKSAPARCGSFDDNGNKVVEKFPYNQKQDAEDLLAKKLEEKKGTFYINMVKEEIKE